MSDISNFEMLRQMHTVLVLHFLEGEKQNDIAERLNLSKSKVNRLIADARRMGLVSISINTPFQDLLTIERDLIQIGYVSDAVVTPTIPGNSELTLRQVCAVAGNHFLEHLKDGDIIAITGGKALSELVDNLKPERSFQVTVVPLTGGVQGKFFTDVNNLVSRLAEKLGGDAMVVHAPLFAESIEQRDLLMNIASTREVFDLARKATIALVGVGSISTSASSYYDLYPVAQDQRKSLITQGICAEFMAHLIDANGKLVDVDLNRRLVAIEPNEIFQCKQVIAIASGESKVRPLMAAMKAGYIKSLVTDEDTALDLSNLLKEEVS